VLRSALLATTGVLLVAAVVGITIASQWGQQT
jgi:hypothetical protein